MPVLDGNAVLKILRATDLKQPVIVLTGDTNPEKERQVRALRVHNKRLGAERIDRLDRGHSQTCNQPDGNLAAKHRHQSFQPFHRQRRVPLGTGTDQHIGKLFRVECGVVAECRKVQLSTGETSTNCL
jgi:CheY-like chemotaxis protein